LAGCGAPSPKRLWRVGDFGWRCQQNSDYQPVGLRFASLPALSSLSQKRNLISLPVLSVQFYRADIRNLNLQMIMYEGMCDEQDGI